MPTKQKTQQLPAPKKNRSSLFRRIVEYLSSNTKVFAIFTSTGLLPPFLCFVLLDYVLLALDMLILSPKQSFVQNAFSTQALASLPALLSVLFVCILIRFCLDALQKTLGNYLKNKLAHQLDNHALKHAAMQANNPWQDQDLNSQIDDVMNDTHASAKSLISALSNITTLTGAIVFLGSILVTPGLLTQGCLAALLGASMMLITKPIANRIVKATKQFMQHKNQRRFFYWAYRATHTAQKPNHRTRIQQAYKHHSAAISRHNAWILKLKTLQDLIIECFQNGLEYFFIPLVLLRSYFLPFNTMSQETFISVVYAMRGMSNISTYLSTYMQKANEIAQTVATCRVLLGIDPHPHNPSAKPSEIELKNHCIKARTSQALCFSGEWHKPDSNDAKLSHVFKSYQLTIPYGLTALTGPNGAGKSVAYRAICNTAHKDGYTALALYQTQTLPDEPTDLWGLILDFWPHAIALPHIVVATPQTQRACRIQGNTYSPLKTKTLPPQSTKTYSSFDIYDNVQNLPVSGKKNTQHVHKNTVLETAYKILEALDANEHFTSKGQPFHANNKHEKTEITKDFQNNPLHFFNQEHRINRRFDQKWIHADRTNGGARCLLLACVYLTIALHTDTHILILDEIDKEWDHKTTTKWHALLDALNQHHFKQHTAVIETTHRGANTHTLSRRYNHFMYAFARSTDSIVCFSNLWELIQHHPNDLSLYLPDGKELAIPNEKDISDYPEDHQERAQKLQSTLRDTPCTILPKNTVPMRNAHTLFKPNAERSAINSPKSW